MSDPGNIVLVGGGGPCKSVIDAVESAGYTILGILDMPEYVGSSVLGYPVVGTDEDLVRYVDKALFLVTVGHIKDASLRIRLHERILSVGGCLATVVASTARVSRYASIGEGSVVLHHAMVNADAHIGKGCIINTFANIEHDAVIGDFCHISTGAMVNGNCAVGRGVFLGSQSVMVNGVGIMDSCVIAAGSVVRKNIVKKGIYSGNPALLKIKL